MLEDARRKTENARVNWMIKCACLKALFTRYILTDNIAIKRYCDKYVFDPLVSIGQGKLFTKREVP